MIWEDDHQFRMVRVCKQGLVASFVIHSRNIEIKTDEIQGSVKVSTGTPDILFEGLGRFFSGHLAWRSAKY
jgi:hypothetical protein